MPAVLSKSPPHLTRPFARLYPTNHATRRRKPTSPAVSSAEAAPNRVSRRTNLLCRAVGPGPHSGESRLACTLRGSGRPSTLRVLTNRLLLTNPTNPSIVCSHAASNKASEWRQIPRARTAHDARAPKDSAPASLLGPLWMAHFPRPTFCRPQTRFTLERMPVGPRCEGNWAHFFARRHP